MQQTWDKTFVNHSVFFQPLIQKINPTWLQADAWPSLSDYQAWTAKFAITNENNECINPVAMNAQQEISYETLIYTTGQLPTRENNWHDFFNLLVWLSFPKIKSYINQQHWHSMQQRNFSPNRTRYEQTLAHFDENGVIVFCRNKSLLNLLKQFQWQELFWGHREEVIHEMHFFVFGHALYEKLLNPYVGLTGCGLLINEQYRKDKIDEMSAAILQNRGKELNTLDFQPIPMLGVPGCWPQNQSPDFYLNTNYFRPGRRKVICDYKCD